MSRWARVIAVFISGFLVLAGADPGLFAQSALEAAARTFPARGVIMEIKPDAGQVIIRHEAISNYMEGMTMPFNVKDPEQLVGLQRGDQITFQLHVTDDKSWVDHFQKIGTVSLPQATPSTAEAPVSHPDRSILSYKFTNELGEAMSFKDFHGQALAITFFYTRCPLPDFCPRLSKNFQQASQKLEAMTNAPTNWHFISVSFDPEFDTPQMLKSYGTSYGYDPAHWSFFTGPQDKIADLARGAGVEYSVDNGTINHNFRTLIVDPNGHLQTVFPTSGDLSDQIVSEILKAAAVQPKSGLVNR
jgi:protein SCO1/2